MDKQFIPVPEYLTPLGVGESEMYDMISNGECVFFVFDKDTYEEDIEPKYYSCMPGFGGSSDEIALVPTVHCKECGQRMNVDDIPLPSGSWNIPGVILHAKFAYSCNCGAKYSKENGWTHTGGDSK